MNQDRCAVFVLSTPMIRRQRIHQHAAHPVPVLRILRSPRCLTMGWFLCTTPALQKTATGIKDENEYVDGLLIMHHHTHACTRRYVLHMRSELSVQEWNSGGMCQPPTTYCCTKESGAWSRVTHCTLVGYCHLAR